MVCKQCGNSVKSDFKYCPYCGERMLNDFHDQFHDLTPPFVIHDIPDNGEELYGDPPEDPPVFEAPRAFGFEPEPPQPEPKRYPNYEAQREFGFEPEPPRPEPKRYPDYEAPREFGFEPEPLRPEPKRHPDYEASQPYERERYQPKAEEYGESQPRIVRPQELDFTEPEQEYGDFDDTPYIVYQPNGEVKPRTAQTAKASQEFYTAAARTPQPAVPPKKPVLPERPGMGIGMKLAAILITLMLAGGISVIGYRLLMPDQPFSHPAEDGASFASTLLL